MAGWICCRGFTPFCGEQAGPDILRLQCWAGFLYYRRPQGVTTNHASTAKTECRFDEFTIKKKKKTPAMLPGACLIAQLVKNLPAMQETSVRLLGWEDSLEEGTATHSSVLAWRIHGVTKIGHD